MHFMWFTERAYHYDPEVDPAKYHALENQIVGLRSFFNTPNRFFEREHRAKLLNQYLDGDDDGLIHLVAYDPPCFGLDLCSHLPLQLSFSQDRPDPGYLPPALTQASGIFGLTRRGSGIPEADAWRGPILTLQYL